jgi:hypothetical protein
VARISKEEANYRLADGRKRCGNCSMFKPDDGACTLVRGTIRAWDTCDKWEAKK